MEQVLIIVDVQKEFSDYIQYDMVSELNKYAEKFNSVYQIWDSHEADEPSYTFPNQVGDIKKLFGKNHFSDKVKSFIEKIEKGTDEGKTFKLSNGCYLVRVKNNHGWFYVNEDLVELISKLKGKDVILVGGANDECIEDLYQSFLAFGLNTRINKKYVYSADTSVDDSVNDTKVNESKILSFSNFILNNK